MTTDRLGQRPADRLFVYGIFLDKAARKRFGMTNAFYTTVQHYATFGHSIVTARKMPSDKWYSLSGMIVDIDPVYWDELDALERGYDRVIVKTTDAGQAWMYIGKEY